MNSCSCFSRYLVRWHPSPLKSVMVFMAQERPSSSPLIQSLRWVSSTIWTCQLLEKSQVSHCPCLILNLDIRTSYYILLICSVLYASSQAFTDGLTSWVRGSGPSPEGLNVRTQISESGAPDWVSAYSPLVKPLHNLWVSPCENTAGDHGDVKRAFGDKGRHRCWCAVNKHVISAAEFMRSILPLPAAPPLAWTPQRFLWCCECFWSENLLLVFSCVKGKFHRKSRYHRANIPRIHVWKRLMFLCYLV